MKVRVPLAVVAVVLGALAIGAPAYAQVTLRVDIPSAFTVAGKSAPAGSYEIAEQTPDVLKMQSSSGKGPQFELPVITRLASDTDADSKVVFDKVGNTLTLSEVWIAGQDGYLVFATKGPHTHQTNKGTKK